MPLNQIAEDVWTADGSVAPMPGFRMGARMTVLGLPTGGLLLHSPIELDIALASAIDALGNVEHLVAPNLFHHFFLGAAAERWSAAKTWAPEGLAAKVDSVEIDETLSPGEAWLGCLDVFAIAGMPKFREHVFFHRASGTLVVADLLFHHPKGSFLAGLFFRLAGTHGKTSVSKLFKSLIKDRKAFELSLEPLFELPIERVVMAHGEVLDKSAKETFVEAVSRA